ncbi:MAG: ROK family transcriptional regulator [Terriglobia bacterium]
MPKIKSPRSHLFHLLSLIYSHQRLSRTQLVDYTGFSTFLVSKLTDRLLKEGLISEVGAGISSGGRPPTLLAINPSIGRVLGVHIGTINLRAVLSDLNGEILAYRIDKSYVEEGPEKALRHMLNVARNLLRQGGVKAGKLSGIGIGIGGVLDRESGVTLSWPRVPSWIDVPVKSIVQRSLRTYVEVDDTPRTMALAEKRFGKARSAREFIYLALGAGTGAALFINGQLYTGKGGFAGEFGHTTIDERGPLCSCGNRGCLEVMVSASTIIHRAEEALATGLSRELYRIARENGNQLNLDSIARAAEANDRFSLALLSEVSLHVATGVTSLINLLNPELIILGGGLIRGVGQWLLPSVQRVVRERAMPNPAKQVSIELSALPEIDWARGAALLVSNEVIRGALHAWRKV